MQETVDMDMKDKLRSQGIVLQTPTHVITGIFKRAGVCEPRSLILTHGKLTC